MAYARDFTDRQIVEALRASGGVRSAAAHALGIAPRSLARRLQSMSEFDIQTPSVVTARMDEERALMVAVFEHKIRPLMQMVLTHTTWTPMEDWLRIAEDD